MKQHSRAQEMLDGKDGFVVVMGKMAVFQKESASMNQACRTKKGH